VAAALRVIDTEGLEALSMRRLGQELKSGATSLYWHVKDKDQLLDLVLDAVIGEVPLDDDPSQPWRERAAHLVRGLRQALLRHRHTATIFGTRVTLGPATLSGVDYLLGIFRAAGFGGRDLVLAYQSVLNFGVGFAVFEARPLSGAITEGRTPEELGRMVSEMLTSLPRDRFPNLPDCAADMQAVTDDDYFEYGLQRLLDGLELELGRIQARESIGSGAGG
jgi:TetR/AcrR family tetracycline transcriptional repressor